MINKSTVKYIQSLRTKKFRDLHNAFIAEGPKVVTEFLENDLFKYEAIYCTAAGAQLLRDKLKDKVPSELSLAIDFELEKISSLDTANKVVGIFKKKPSSGDTDYSGKLTLVLDDIQDPGNLGTIIRIADWFGIENIICSPATADCYNPKVVQSTMASLGRVNIVYENLPEIFELNKNIRKYAAVLGGEDISGIGKIAEGFVIIGNESKGISEALLGHVNKKISISKIGEAESLNAGVAAGIILFSLTNPLGKTPSAVENPDGGL